MTLVGSTDVVSQLRLVLTPSPTVTQGLLSCFFCFFTFFPLSLVLMVVKSAPWTETRAGCKDLYELSGHQLD